jgi:RNA polymerase sigma-70 factor (sigma-E family)
VTKDEDYAAYVSARWTPLVRAAVLLGCSRPEAEDLVQTVLVRCYVSWEIVMKATDRDSFVYRMLVNARATSRRRRWWGERPSDRLPEHGDGTDAFELSDLTQSVRQALGTLGKDARDVVVLRYYADLTEHQTAEVLGIPIGTVKSRVSRALAQLAGNPALADLSEGGSR